MVPKTSAAEFLPNRLNLTSLRRAAVDCRGCDLYRNATQTVFGVGPRNARLILLGEMPGDQEDIQGLPFVGPAGRLLDEALIAAEIDRDDVYVTNAVKHFRWEPRGKRRLHKTPNQRHIEACKPWLQAEILVLKPAAIVCLGATAAKALLGRGFRVSTQRGKFVDLPDGPVALATHHPSGILRSPEKADRDRKRGELVADLHRAATLLAG
jgi:DNA polymerase